MPSKTPVVRTRLIRLLLFRAVLLPKRPLRLSVGVFRQRSIGAPKRLFGWKPATISVLRARSRHSGYRPDASLPGPRDAVARPPHHCRGRRRVGVGLGDERE